MYLLVAFWKALSLEHKGKIRLKKLKFLAIMV